MFELLLIIIAVFSESRGEGFDGMLGVASVIRNRAEICDMQYLDVILKRKQFSCFNNNWKNVKRDFEFVNDTDLKSLETSIIVSFGIYFSIYDDNTNGATHYHSKAVSPEWKNKMKVTKYIGNHIFYKNT